VVAVTDKGAMTSLRTLSSEAEGFRRDAAYRSSSEDREREKRLSLERKKKQRGLACKKKRKRKTKLLKD